MATREQAAVSTTETSDTRRVRVGRQAIFDRNREVHAYELLFRGARIGPGDEDTGDSDTSNTILDAFVEIGIERLTGGKPAFINFTRRFFVDMPPIPFQPDAVVLEILEDIPVDTPLIQAVSALREQGYRVAIDDYEFESHWDPLLPLVDIVKVEITERTLPDIAARLEPLRAQGLTLLAEKVETPEQYHQLHQCGFDLFQGFFFARPDVVETQGMKEFQPSLVRLLAQVHDPDVEIEELARLIALDASLSYKLLRLINSPAVGLRRQVESIQQAVVLLGLERIRAWATLFVLADRADSPMELFNLGLLRANLCERLARESGLGRPDTAYTVGLLSVLDGMLSMPMDEALRQLPLPDVVRDAISTMTGDYGRLLQQAIALDQGIELPGMEIPGLGEGRLMELYLESSDAAFTALATL
ncbi:MAG: HDOD domain-containing protein [Gammaproteobacteria bacterium]|nr:MAG: HDOD domain-containing protein [Gammaproteobacteria bacterium]